LNDVVRRVVVVSLSSVCRSSITEPVAILVRRAVAQHEAVVLRQQRARDGNLVGLIVAEENGGVVAAAEATTAVGSNATHAVTVVRGQVRDIGLLCAVVGPRVRDVVTVLREAVAALGDAGVGILLVGFVAGEGAVHDGFVGGVLVDALAMPPGLVGLDLGGDFVVGAGDVDDGTAFLELAGPADGSFRGEDAVLVADAGDHGGLDGLGGGGGEAGKGNDEDSGDGVHVVGGCWL